MALLPTPPGTKFGKFVGRWGQFVGDTVADTDAHPDFIPGSGTVEIIPEYSGYIKRTDLGVAFTLSTIKGRLNDQGQLVDENGSLGVEQVASDSPGDPTNITYTISLNINGSRRSVSGVALLGDTEVDIPSITPSGPGQPFFQSTDSVLAATLLEPNSESNAAILYLTGGGAAAPASIDGGKPNSINNKGIDGGRP
jgi:hypothetical protein